MYMEAVACGNRRNNTTGVGVEVVDVTEEIEAVVHEWWCAPRAQRVVSANDCST